MKKQRLIEIAVKVLVAALTAFLTAITTTSCTGYGPLPPLFEHVTQLTHSLQEAPHAWGASFLESDRLLTIHVNR